MAKTDTGASAADCGSCGENISVLISCEEGADKRQISLMALEQRDDKLAGTPALVTIKSDAKTLTLAGTYSQPGEAGPYPVLRYSMDDQVFEFLSHAGIVEFIANGVTREVGMKGSRAALKAMNGACK